MYESVGSKSADFGEMTWPSCDLFSEESFSNKASDAVSGRSNLDKGHIRLVKIEPGDRDGVIRCHTQIFLLERTDEYTALSYTWGSTLLSQPIEVDGHRRLIPKNLWRFLRQARQCPQQLSGWLWIDVLSIDQSCAWERTHQVNMMADIFRNASTVVVWTGPAYGDSSKALKILSKANAANKKTWIKLCSGSMGLAFQSFCERAYWRRLWVFQELKFARNIVLICGERLVPWSRLESFMLYAQGTNGAPRLKDRVDAIIKSPAGVMVELTLTSLDTSLWELLLTTKHLRCAVPHDKVYGILSVAELGHENISPDYTMPLPVLLNRVLGNMHALAPPRHLDAVTTKCEILQTLFDVPSETIFAPPTQPSQELDEARHFTKMWRLGPSDSHISLWWTAYYGHAEVQRLLLQAWDDSWLGGSQSPTDAGIKAASSVLNGCCFLANTGELGRQWLETALASENLAMMGLFLALPELGRKSWTQAKIYKARQSLRWLPQRNAGVSTWNPRLDN